VIDSILEANFTELTVESDVKELMILAGVCAVLGLGCLGGAGFALLGGEEVGVGRIFGVLVFGLIGISLLGAAQSIARTAMGIGRKQSGNSQEQAHSA
jgi:hypothetical protein